MRPGNLLPRKRTRVLGVRVGPRRVDWGRIAPIVVGTTAAVIGIDRLRRSSASAQDPSDLLLEFYEDAGDENGQWGPNGGSNDGRQHEERRDVGEHGEAERTMTEPSAVRHVVAEPPTTAEPSRSSLVTTGDSDTSAGRLTADGRIGVSLLRWEFATIRLRLVLRGLAAPAAERLAATYPAVSGRRIPERSMIQDDTPHGRSRAS